MFNLFKSKKGNSSFSFLETDMHSHVLPGIDDGAKDIEDSIHLIKSLYDLGYRKLIATPHVYQEYYPNTNSSILSSLNKVKEAIKERQLDIEIDAAAEYFMDEHFQDLLDSDEILSFGDNYILVEQSFISEIPGLDEILFTIQAKGYQPILAHPERYTYWASNFERYEQIREQGVLLQVNILSLTGQYGKTVQKTAKRLIDRNMVSFLGTDLHHEMHIELLNKLLKNYKMMQWLSSKKWHNNNICSSNVNV